MKKILGIVVLGLLLSGNAYSKTIVVKANPEKGFNFPYLLKTSKKTSDAKYLIVESNSTFVFVVQVLTAFGLVCLDYFRGLRLFEFCLGLLNRQFKGAWIYPE